MQVLTLPYEAVAQLEPAVIGHELDKSARHEVGELHIQFSQAVSLRRIADALNGTNGISVAQAIENAISTGMFHGFQNMPKS